MQIGPYSIGPSYPPFIIAEISGNHQGFLEKALKLVEEAKAAGAHAVKLQTYTPDTITLDVDSEEFLIKDPNNLWTGRHLYNLYQEAHTPWEWHPLLFQRCRELDLLCFSTPFDESAVDFLETLDVPCYKIASLEIVDLPLIRKAAALKKPLILSTAGASLAEITEAVDTIRSAGCRELALLKCTTAHPAPPAECHLRTLPHLAAAFDLPVGLSDHTLGLGVPLASIALGACIIEKHLTLSRKEGAVDSAFSLEPHEFKTLVTESRRAWEALGEICYKPMPSEKVSLSHRPSLYFVQDLAAGQTLEARHVLSVRPNKGLPPKEIDTVIGMRLQKAVKRGTPVSWDLFK